MTVARETLRQAYRQAYFLHPNAGTALQVTVRGFLLFKNLARMQNQRGKYSPSPSSLGKRLPNKVTLSDNQLLQRAIWEVSEYYERLEEAARFGTEAPIGPPVTFSSETENFIRVFSALLNPQTASGLTEEDLLIRYLKHLSKISVPHNALHVAIAFNQFLFDYETRETLLVYEGVDPKFERGKEEKQIEDTRTEIWEKRLWPRFEGILQADRTKTRRVIFRSALSNAWRRVFVRACLEKLTLWDTNCSDGQDDADFKEHQRIHKLVHPDCHDQLIARAGLAHSAERLRLPIFPGMPVKTGGQGQGGDRFNPTDLPEEVYQHLLKLFDDSNRRQQQSAASQLLVLVDRLEKADVNLLEDESTRCALPANAQLIEVYSREADGDLLLATCWLSEFNKSEAPVVAKTRAEGGQVICFDIAFAEDGAATVEITYRETRPVRWLALEWRRLAYRLAAFQPKPMTALTIGAILVGLIALSVFWLRQKPNQLPEIVRPASPTVEPSPIDSPRAQPPLLAENRGLTGQRGSSRRTRGLLLGSVARIYIQSLGEDEFGKTLREALIDRLRQSPLTVEDRMPAMADAMLQQEPGIGKQAVSLRLVNKDGEVLWQESFKRRDAGQIAELAVNNLIEAIESEKRMPK